MKALGIRFGVTLFALIACHATNSGHAQPSVPYKVAPPADWIRQKEISELDTTIASHTQSGTSYLLSDIQIRYSVDTDERYVHWLARVENSQGLDKASQVSVEVNPQYQELRIHHVRVHRDGEIIDRLDADRIELLRRETALEYQIYDGTLTANLLLHDVRIGDVLEAAYTIVGRNPVFGEGVDETVYVGMSVPIGHLRRRVLVPADLTVRIRNHQTALAAVELDRGEYHEYVWEDTGVAAIDWESGSPSWFNPYPRVQLSTYETWGDVARWGASVFDSGRMTSPTLQREVRRVTAGLPDRDAQIMALLRFVQDDIRYVGLEIGPGSHRPRDPTTVLRERLGDCKDKSLLLVTMLDEIGVAAEPALVNTELRGHVQDLLPSPLAFDHSTAVIFLENGDSVWVDATRPGQVGSLDRLAPPEYERALILKGSADRLTQIPEESLDEPLQNILTTVDLSSGRPDSTSIRIETTYRGSAADKMRARLRYQNSEDLQESYLDYYRTNYSTITSSAPLDILVYGTTNEVYTHESYVISEAFVEDKSSFESTFSVYSRETYDLLPDVSNVNRTTPLSQDGPTRQTHRIRVLLPFSLDVERSDLHIENEYLEFDFYADYTDLILTLNYDLTLLADHVMPEDLGTYAHDITAIEEVLSFEITEPADLPAWGWLLLGFTIILPVMVTAEMRRRSLHKKWNILLAPTALCYTDEAPPPNTPPGPGAFEHAGFWRRVAAHLIDSSLMLGVLWVAAGFYSLSTLPDRELILGLLFFILPFAYYTAMESSPVCATAGKIILGIRVVSLTGDRVSVARALGRNLAKVISGLLLYAGFIMAGVTRNKQGLHDLLADCLVIRPSPARELTRPSASAPQGDSPAGSSS